MTDYPTYKPKRRIWPWVIALIGLAMCAGLFTTLLAKGAGETTRLPEDEDSSVQKAVSGPSPVKPRGSQPSEITEGIWEVGTTGGVASGTYRVSDALDTGSTCYWAIMSGPGDDPNAIIQNDIVTGGTPQVTLKKGQWFKTSGCGVWKRR